MAGRALAGLRILDLTQLIAGPYCTKLLADYGADVVKVEKPGRGDLSRGAGAPPGSSAAASSTLFVYLNGNKRSLALDLQSRRGRALFLELAASADAVVESFRPGTLARWGLSYQALRRRNRRLVLTSISNFGGSGPRRRWPATDLVLYALGGWLHAGGEPAREPLRPGGHPAPYVAGVHGAVGTLAALAWAEATGQGQQVDISVQEALVATSASIWLLGYSYEGRLRQRAGNTFPQIILPAADGFIGINILTQEQWEALCAFLGLPDLAADPRFSTPLGRAEHGREVGERLAAAVARRSCKELFAAGQAWRIPFGLVPALPEVLELPQHRARGYFVAAEEAAWRGGRMPGAPFKMGATPWERRRPAPRLGEHSTAVLRELGHTTREIALLRRQGVVA